MLKSGDAILGVGFGSRIVQNGRDILPLSTWADSSGISTVWDVSAYVRGLVRGILEIPRRCKNKLSH